MGMIKTLTTLSSFVASPSFFDLTKKEQSMKKRLLKKIELVYKGVKSLKVRPDLVIILDGQLMQKFVHEAEKVGVPAIVCTSSNLNVWSKSHLITCNINSSKSVDFVLKYILS
jgi:small subunit ribosomal protein S2